MGPERELDLKKLAVTPEGDEIYVGGPLRVLRSRQTGQGCTLHWVSVGSLRGEVSDPELVGVMGQLGLGRAAEIRLNNGAGQKQWMEMLEIAGCREILALTAEDGSPLAQDPDWPEVVPDRVVVGYHFCAPGRN